MIGSTNVVPRFVRPPIDYFRIQSLVRQGKAQEKYSLGDIITVSHGDYGDIEWQVVAFDVATPADASLTHSMTLCSKYCIDMLQFDNREASNSDSYRQQYGNNRYAYSAIKQWLNSDKAAGQWWAKQHSRDVAPDYATTKDGFMKGLDPDFLAVIGKTKIKVVIPSIDGDGYEELEDKFYLSSIAEMGFGNENNIAEGANFSYFNSNSQRMKQYNYGTAYGACAYWCRTPDFNVYRYVRLVNTNGTMNEDYAKSPCGIVPFCNII